ncbi:PREDICTED: uncharacterized protein LOC109152130 [Ipomoea nil]|uniref:uncharacterized protein LOC109152130 n=1 Tax=Ipomoea nil TaxID=35883 RepID=UPI0009008EF3|nr:PREDICTED: uncharacterized protein LOC109152130 [Ipomoea nil]
MPFGLKNAGATYTRMVARLLQGLLGKFMAAYVDDMLVIKSPKESSHAPDLAECFRVMLKYNLRLNPKKCAFVVQGGNFLGYMVIKRGIEPNPEKVQAIMDMQPPSSIKDLQRFTGRLAALSRFLSKAADKTVPFFEAMKKKEGFAWTAECQESFEELKRYLSTLPVLSTPQVGEPLYLYLAASPKAVSSVLVREEEQVQHPVYYVSRSLKSAEIRYTPLEKVVYALVVTVRKLAPYFQAHTGSSTSPVLRSKDRRWLTSWSSVQWGKSTGIPTPEKESGEWWELHADGAASSQHCGDGVMLVTPEGFRLYYALSYQFRASNNEAEYEAVLGGIRLAKALGVDRFRIKRDSRLVVGQVSRTCEARSDRLVRYKEKTVESLRGFVAHEIEHISRSDNTEADILSKIALEGVPDHFLRICLKEDLPRPSIEEPSEEIQQVKTLEWDRDKNPEMPWIEDILRYKEEGKLHDDHTVAARVRRKAPSFEIVDGQLYKKSFGGPFLKCLLQPEAEKIMDEAHRGICAAHQDAHTLARKLVVQGYYWPTMMRDCVDWITKCIICQAFARKDTRPATFYASVVTAIPVAN